MKKLLVAAGDKDFNTVTLDFACYIARLTRSSLTGILPESSARNSDSIDHPADSHTNEATATAASRSRADLSDDRKERFMSACTSRNVRGLLQESRSLQGLIDATRFADAIIMDSDFTMHENLLESAPTHWAKKLLHEAMCPVIVTPFNFEKLNEIILTYDGSKSSLYAIREFIHLLPELKDIPVTILQVWLEEESVHHRTHELEDWLELYFGKVNTVIIESPTSDQLLEYLLAHPDAFVVMGGFGRGRISRLLQPSTSGTAVKLLANPMFVAHT